MIKLGQTVKCKMTGFTGVAGARLEFMNGCVQLLVRPKKKAKETEYPAGVYIDIEFLDVVKGAKIIRQNERKALKVIPSGGIRSYSNR